MEGSSWWPLPSVQVGLEVPGSLVAKPRGSPCVQKAHTLVYFRNWFDIAIKTRAGVGMD